MNHRLSLILIASSLFAGISASTDSHEAVITYDSPIPGTCTLELSETYEDYSGTTPANTNIFTMSDDVYPLKVPPIGARRQVLTPTLKAHTQYYARLCGTLRTSFVTKIPPVGNITPRNVGTGVAVNPAAPGVAVPDPITGVPIRYLNWPGHGGLRSDSTRSFAAVVATGTWSNVSNALLAGTGSYASTSTINDYLMLYPNPSTAGSMMETSWMAGRVLEDLCAKVTRGAGSFGVGISLDNGATVLSEVTGSATGTYPSGCPAVMFSSWGGAHPSIPREFIPVGGTVNCTDGGGATSACTVQFPNYFSRISQATFTKVLIGGTVYPVVSRSSTANFVITGNLTVTGATFITLHFGIRVRNTASASLQVNVGYISAGTQSIQSRAETMLCSRVAHTDGSYKCAIQMAFTGGTYMASITPTGEVRYLGEIPLADFSSTAPSTAFSHGFGKIIGFSATDPNVFYILMNGNDGQKRIYKGTYTGDALESIDYNYGGTQGGALPTSPSPAVTWSIVANLTTLLGAAGYTNQYDDGACSGFGCWLGASALSVSGDYAMTYAGKQDDGPAYLAIFKLSTGTLVKMIHTFDGADGGSGTDAFRWCSLHATQAVPFGPLNTFVVGCNQLKSGTTRRNAGPWLMTIGGVYRSGVLDTSTKAIPWPSSGLDMACPLTVAARWQALGATGNACVHLRVSTLPDSALAGVKDTVTLKVGDMFVDYTLALSLNNYETEHFRIVTAPTSVGGGAWEFYAQRDAVATYCNYNSHHGAQNNTHASAWVAMMTVGQEDACLGALTLVNIDPATDAITTHETPREIAYAHFAIGGSRTDPANTLFVNGAGFTDGDLMTISGLAKTHTITGFANLALPLPPIQSYPEHTQAGEMIEPWTTDFSAYLPNGGCAIEIPCSIGLSTRTATGVTDIWELNAIGGTSTRLASPGLVDYKRAPLIGTSGRFPLVEVSSPTANALVDAPDNSICHAYETGECFTASGGGVKGKIYVKASIFDPDFNCNVNASYLRAPCIIWGHPLGGFAFRNGVTRSTINAEDSQRILSAPLGCSGYAKWTTTPDGKRGLFPPCMWGPDWIGGYIADLPPYKRDSNSTARGNFQILDVQVKPYSVVEFGYTSDFRCVDGRAERCLVVSSTVSTSNPFSFAHEAPVATNTTKIAVPLQSNRAAWVKANGVTQLVITY